MPQPPDAVPPSVPGEQFHLALSAVLRHERLQQALTLEELCARVPGGLHPSTLNRYERGSRGLLVGRLYDLSVGLHLQVFDLVSSAAALLDETCGQDSLAVDLMRLARTSEPTLAPAADWARTRLTETTERHVPVSYTDLTELAARCRVTPARLTALLRRNEVITAVHPVGERS